MIAETVKKMETNGQSNLKVESENDDAQQSKKRKLPTNGHTDTTNTDDNTVELSETTTVDDISTMDVSTYLAWVNRQAKSLPNVFVATSSTSTQEEDTSIDRIHTKEQQTKTITKEANDNKSIANGSKEKKEEDEPFHGSKATLQILLSKRMDILPPPTIRHLPPHHINTAVSLGDEDVKMPATEEERNNDSNSNGSNSSKSTWVNNTIANFSKLRSYLETERTKQQRKQRGATVRKIAVPRMKDRAGWHIFCLGKEEAYGNVGGYYEEEEEEDESDVVDNVKDSKKDESSIPIKDDSDKVQSTEEFTAEATQHQSSSKTPPPLTKLIYNPSNIPTQGYQPRTSLILQFDQVLTRTLFHHHVHYFCKWKFRLSYNRCIWIYSLLGNMEKPLHIDEVCGVRRVLRECCLRRWELKLPNEDSEDEDVKQSAIDKSCTSTSASEERDEMMKAKGSCWEQLALLNTLIAITGIYFEQGNAAAGDCMDSLFSIKPVES